MYIYTYVHMYICTYVHMYAYTYSRTLSFLCTADDTNSEENQRSTVISNRKYTSTLVYMHQYIHGRSHCRVSYTAGNM